MFTRRNHQHHHLSQHHLQQQQQQRPKFFRASEYKNLRQVVPSLRRQRDVGKVEVVTEAARYIDHLHKTLIERFVLCGIPDALKDILGTDNANELNSHHIMNLVTNMAAKQRQPAHRNQTEVPRQRHQHVVGIQRSQSQPSVSRFNCSASGRVRSMTPLANLQRTSRHPAPARVRVLPVTKMASLTAATNDTRIAGEADARQLQLQQQQQQLERRKKIKKKSKRYD